MKKILSALAVFCAAFNLCAADQSEAANIETKDKAPKVLIVYFSWSGNTRFAAERIQEAVQGTIFEIKPKQEYPKDYAECVSQAKKEIQAGFKPELASDVENFDAYDLIFIGSPNWWSTIAPPVLSFLSSHDFAGKTVVPFVTHGTGGMARCETDMQKACANAEFLPGKAFYGNRINDSAADLANWAKDVLKQKTAKK